MTHVSVISAHQLGDSISADVELDGVLLVRGVTLAESVYSGRPIALPPCRPHGDGGAVLSWPPSVGAAIAGAIRAALPPGLVAVSEGAAT